MIMQICEVMCDQFSTGKICISVMSYSQRENNNILQAIRMQLQAIKTSVLTTMQSYDHLCCSAAR